MINQNFLIILLIFLSGLYGSLISQEIISDGRLEIKDGQFYSDKVVVCFQNQVVNFSSDQTYGRISEINVNYPELSSCFEEFCQSQNIPMMAAPGAIRHRD